MIQSPFQERGTKGVRLINTLLGRKKREIA
jgi:hypothetical protein